MISADQFQHNFVDDVDDELHNPTDKRLFAVAAAFARGYSVEKIWEMTSIDKWFLKKLERLHKMETALWFAIPLAQLS